VVREQHGRDESSLCRATAGAVVFAESPPTWPIVALANQYQVPVIPFGVGSSLEGHLLAVQGGISIDVRRMNKVLAINAEDLTVTVQPGVTRKQLNEEIKSTGLFFPIDPGADASIGGMCATRASGTNAVRYGTMRENVLALEVVTGQRRGDPHRHARQKVSCRLRPHAPDGGQRRHAGRDHRDHAAHLPLARGSVGGHLLVPSIEAAVRTTIQIIQLGMPIARVELIDRHTVRMVNAYSKLGLREEPMLLMEFHGSPASVKEQAETGAGDRQRPWRQCL
jgi:D-lactate dehydrogenase (cytochrome)